MPPSPELEARIVALMRDHGMSRRHAEHTVAKMDERAAIDAAGGRRALADFGTYESLHLATWRSADDEAFARSLGDSVLNRRSTYAPPTAQALLEALGVLDVEPETRRRAVTLWLGENDPGPAVADELRALRLAPDDYLAPGEDVYLL